MYLQKWKRGGAKVRGISAVGAHVSRNYCPKNTQRWFCYKKEINTISAITGRIWGCSAAGAHLTGSQGVRGSNPLISTKTTKISQQMLADFFILNLDK